MIDSHAHLDFPQFDADRDEVIDRACEAGVAVIINVGADLISSQRSIGLAERFPFIYAAVGIHPHEAGSWNEETYRQVREMAQHPRVVAIGEIGLDYYWDHSPRDRQSEAFETQLALARELDKPFIVHDRDAHSDIMSMLHREVEKQGTLSGVLHCFSGDTAMAHEAIDMGLYIAVGGPVTFQNARKLSEVVEDIPLSRLLLETDCPYLAPHPHRGKRNEPAYVRLVAERVAALHKVDVTEVDAVTSENVAALFGVDACTMGWKGTN